MELETTFPGNGGKVLRQVMHRTLKGVYADNADRHDPDDLGDGNRAFAGALADNIPHRLRAVTSDFERKHGLPLRLLSGRGTRLRVGEHTICIYKAPPGAADLGALSFDDSDFKQFFTRRNATHDQRVIDFDGGDPAGADDLDDGNDVLALVHFGGPDTGFSHATIGVPYTVEGRIEWAWQEDLYDDGQDYDAASPDAAGDGPAGDRGGFGLRLRRDESSGES